MADKLRTLQNLEALQARYIGTGHADTTKYEWTSNIIRDSYASYIGHPPLLQYMAIGMGEPKEKVRAMMVEKMVRGAGNPPDTDLMGGFGDSPLKELMGDSHSGTRNQNDTLRVRTWPIEMRIPYCK
ncbi:splicing factor 3B subunit 5 [Arthroderma uncinatum]|uniref:splicing factor 3B subunit 5 n=1 Tax=Arthroderma uncinatum TaxID=74035 RepID=UPI00144A6DCE|nr:splicing factor 3B subunit 5 [Arthroderma uncinatum]KAF3491663.1 splicing factor 3B subunit 5 [Arthroderma uncinatum]